MKKGLIVLAIVALLMLATPVFAEWTIYSSPIKMVTPTIYNWNLFSGQTEKLGAGQGDMASVGWQLPMVYTTDNPVFYHSWQWNETNQITPDYINAIMIWTSDVYFKLQHYEFPGDPVKESYIRVHYQWDSLIGGSGTRESITIFSKRSGQSEVQRYTFTTAITWDGQKYTPFHKVGCEMVQNFESQQVWCDVRIYRTNDGTTFSQIYNNPTNFWLSYIRDDSTVTCQVFTRWDLAYTGSIPATFKFSCQHKEKILGDGNGDRCVDIWDAIMMARIFGDHTTDTFGTDTWFNWANHFWDFTCIQGSIGEVDILDNICFSNHYQAHLD